MAFQDFCNSRRRFLAHSIMLCSTAAYSICYGCQSTYANGSHDMQSETNPRLFSFVGGEKGDWRVESISTIVGDPIPNVSHVDIVHGNASAGDPEGWIFRGVTSNERYANRDEKQLLLSRQAALGRPKSNLAALIPIRKNAQWWALTQDERRAIFEEQSNHTTIGLKYLPEIARRLHHCRDLPDVQPFDFLTFFDYSEADRTKFDDLLAELRRTEEWKYVDREVDIRLVRVQ